MNSEKLKLISGGFIILSRAGLYIIIVTCKIRYQFTLSLSLDCRLWVGRVGKRQMTWCILHMHKFMCSWFTTYMSVKEKQWITFMSRPGSWQLRAFLASAKAISTNAVIDTFDSGPCRPPCTHRNHKITHIIETSLKCNHWYQWFISSPSCWGCRRDYPL